ncbi:MAG: hypothetical protein ACRDQD_00595 [Nocardioidaceae bacterium]
MKTVETTASEVWCHALNHSDKPVIHGAEIDYDDVHDGVRYHADLLEAACKRADAAHKAYDSAAVTLAIDANYAERDGEDPRTWGAFADHLAAFRAADVEERAAHKHLMAMYAKRDQITQVPA